MTPADFQAPARSRAGAAKAKERPEPPLGNHQRVRAGCPWYRHCTGDGAATCAEPDWHAAASITARTVNGEETFHDYSRAHPSYDEREAATKYARALTEAGPRTCVAIEEAGNENFCGSCVNRGRITSPIELGRSYDPGETGPIPLGFTQAGSYALLDQQRQIIVLREAGQLLDPGTLIGLADRSFWQSRFPGKAGYDARAAGEALISACREKGPFDPTKLRGRGVWLEGDRVVTNLGGPIPPDTRNRYVCFEPLEIQTAETFPTARLKRLLDAFPWRRPTDAMLLLGWLAIAPICGALKWRPHFFLYGPPNSGKTTLHALAADILFPLGLPADGQSTEAGIRQTLGPDSRPLIIDEFEADQKQSRLQNIMRLARSASSADSPVLRGTPEGRALQYSIRTTIFFSAVNVIGLSPADETRVLILELTPHQSDAGAGQFIASERHFFADQGPMWCGWMARNVLDVVAAIDRFQAALVGTNSRHRLNIATLLAGGFVALQGRPPTVAEAADWAAEYAGAIQHHGLAHERNDAQEALNHLFAHAVRSDNAVTFPLANWIAIALEASQGGGARPNNLVDADNILAMFDMRLVFDGPQPGLLLRNGSPAIDRVYSDTRWANGAWKRALGQLPGAFSPRDPIRFPNSGAKARAVGLPLELLPPPYSARLLDGI